MSNPEKMPEQLSFFSNKELQSESQPDAVNLAEFDFLADQVTSDKKLEEMTKPDKISLSSFDKFAKENPDQQKFDFPGEEPNENIS